MISKLCHGLTQVGRDLDALEVYRKIFEWNRSEDGVQYEVTALDCVR